MTSHPHSARTCKWTQIRTDRVMDVDKMQLWCPCDTKSDTMRVRSVVIGAALSAAMIALSTGELEAISRFASRAVAHGLLTVPGQNGTVEDYEICPLRPEYTNVMAPVRQPSFQKHANCGSPISPLPCHADYCLCTRVRFVLPVRVAFISFPLSVLQRTQRQRPFYADCAPERRHL